MASMVATSLGASWKENGIDTRKLLLALMASKRAGKGAPDAEGGRPFLSEAAVGAGGETVAAGALPVGGPTPYLDSCQRGKWATSVACDMLGVGIRLVWRGEHAI